MKAEHFVPPQPLFSGKTMAQNLDLEEIKRAQSIATIVANLLQGKLLKPSLLTDKEAGEMLSISADTVRTLAVKGELVRIAVGEGSKRITVASVEAYIARQVAAVG